MGSVIIHFKNTAPQCFQSIGFQYGHLIFNKKLFYQPTFERGKNCSGCVMVSMLAWIVVELRNMKA